MTNDWRALTREAGYSLSQGAIRVRFPGGREQYVFVEPAEDGEGLRAWSKVARPSVVAAAQRQARLDSPHSVAWSRNSSTDLLGFKVDSRGWLIGESWVPLAGLDAEEWGVWIRTLAQACDRLEYLLSGRDES